MKYLLYCSILFSIIGSGFASLDLVFFRLSFFRISIGLILAITLFNFFKNNEKIDFNFKSNQFSIQFMIFWFVYALISVFWVADFLSWVRAIFFIGIGVISVLLMRKYFTNSNDILKALRVIFPVLLFHNIIGYFEVVTKLRFTSLLLNKIVYTTQPFSTFVNTNDFALFLMFAIFIMYICFENANNLFEKVSYITIIVSSSALVLLSGSRASLIGLMIGIILAIILKFRFRILVYSVVVTSLILVSAYLIFPTISSEVFSVIINYLRFDFSRSTGSESVRLNLIKNGVYFLIRTFGFGTGAGNIEYWMQHNAIHNVLQVYNIHNWWMEVLVSYGIFIFLLYILFYSNIIYTFTSKLKHSTKLDRSIASGFISIMVGYFVASFSSSSNLSSEWLWMFWSIVITYQGILINIFQRDEPLRALGEHSVLNRNE